MGYYSTIIELSSNIKRFKYDFNDINRALNSDFYDETNPVSQIIKEIVEEDVREWRRAFPRLTGKQPDDPIEKDEYTIHDDIRWKYMIQNNVSEDDGIIYTISPADDEYSQKFGNVMMFAKFLARIIDPSEESFVKIVYCGEDGSMYGFLVETKLDEKSVLISEIYMVEKYTLVDVIKDGGE